MSHERIMNLTGKVISFLSNLNERVINDNAKDFIKKFDEAFSHKDNIIIQCNHAIKVFNDEINKLEGEIKALLPQIEKASEEFHRELDKRNDAERRYNKYRQEADDYQSRARDAINQARNTNDSSYLKRGNNYIESANRASRKAESARIEYESCHVEVYLSILNHLQDEKKVREDSQRELKGRIDHIEQAKDLIGHYEEEKVYYTCHAKHLVFSVLLKEYGKFIDEFKTINSSEEEWYKLLDTTLKHGIDIITNFSIYYYKQNKEYVDIFKKKAISSLRILYLPLVNRFEILASDDIVTPDPKEPLSIILGKKAYEDATNMNDKSAYKNDPHVCEDEFQSKDPKKEYGYNEIKENMVLSRKEIFNQIEPYYKRIKKSTQLYIEESDKDILQMVKELDSSDVKHKTLFKSLEKHMKKFQKHNDKFNEFLSNYIFHPNKLTEFNLEKYSDYIEQEIQPEFNKHLNDYPVDPYGFGIRKYFVMRNNDEKDMFKDEIECYNMINEYEKLFLPLNRCKQQMIIEGYRLLRYFGYLEIIKMLKYLGNDNSYKEIEEILTKEPDDSIKRLNIIKGRLIDMQTKSYNIIKRMIVFIHHISDKMPKFSKYKFDIIYKEYVKRTKFFMYLLSNHLNSDYCDICRNITISIDHLIYLYERKDVNYSLPLLLESLPDLPINHEKTPINEEAKKEKEIKPVETKEEEYEAIEKDDKEKKKEDEIKVIYKDSETIIDEMKKKENEIKTIFDEVRPKIDIKKTKISDGKEKEDDTIMKKDEAIEKADEEKEKVVDTKLSTDEEEKKEDKINPSIDVVNKKDEEEKKKDNDTKLSVDEVKLIINEEKKEENEKKEVEIKTTSNEEEKKEDEIKSSIDETVKKGDEDEIKVKEEERQTPLDKTKDKDDEEDNKKEKGDEIKPSTDEEEKKEDEIKIPNNEEEKKENETKPSIDETVEKENESKPVLDEINEEETQTHLDEEEKKEDKEKEKEVEEKNKEVEKPTSYNEGEKSINQLHSGYQLLKYLISWKFNIIKSYYPSSFEWLYEDIDLVLSNFMDEIKHGYLICCEGKEGIIKNSFHADKMYYENIYDMNKMKLKYSIHGDWNWKMYKTISEDLKIMSKKEDILILSNEEKEFIKRFYLALSIFCENCQSNCEKIIETNIEVQKDYQLFVNRMCEIDRKSKDGKKVIKYNNQMLDDIKGRGFKSLFSCCIPGISINYQYAGKKWCKEKCINEKISKEL